MNKGRRDPRRWDPGYPAPAVADAATDVGIPLPIASILRAWKATPSNDYQTKHERLLHFSEDIPITDRAKKRSLFIDDLLDGKIRKLNLRYAVAEGILI